VAAGNGHSRGRTGRIGYPGFRGNRRSSRPPFGYALLDPQVAREQGVVAAYLFHEALGVLAADEHLERIAGGKSGERASSTTA
jgi:hypothetical protein